VTEGHLAAALIRHRAGKLRKGEKLYRDLLDREPDNVTCLHLLGTLVRSDGRIAEAIALLARAAATLDRTGGATPQHAALYNDLGSALHAAGAAADATAAYRRGLALDPHMISLQTNLGAVLLSGQDFAGAAACYEAALRQDAGDVACWCELATTYRGMGRGDDALAACRRALALDPKRFETHHRLGQLLAALGRPDEAIAALDAALGISPRSWLARLNLAQATALAHRHDVAIELFSRLAAERPNDASVHLGLASACTAANRLDAALKHSKRAVALAPGDANAQFSLARLLHVRNALPEAERAYRTALRLQPDLPSALLNLAALLIASHRPAEAIEPCRRLLTLEPANAEAHCLIGTALMAAGDDTAIDWFRRCLRLKPDFAAALFRLGMLLGRRGDDIEARSYLQQAIALQPDYAAAHAELGNVLLRLGERGPAREAHLRSWQLEPVTTLPAATGAADFSVLLLLGPGVGNTPYRYLVGHSVYHSHFLGILPGLDLDLDDLRSRGDIVVNLISDVDHGRDVLLAAAAVVDRLGKPIINHPRKILSTDRETAAAMLAGIPSCRVPRTRYCARPELTAPDPAALATFSFPLLIRKAGTHGGEAFERIQAPGELADFVTTHPAEHYYVSEYVDYRSADNHFRKYRFIFVHDEILPYHLAISTHWKVHHYSTDMRERVWMQNEESAFLDAPGTVFNEQHFAALRAIRTRIDLEFFGLDCSIDPAGHVVVFEVNASMLVHDDNDAFPYKSPHVAQIKAAFDQMLAQRRARS